MKYIIICLVFLFLIGCSTTGTYKEGCEDTMIQLFKDANLQKIDEHSLKEWCEARRERYMNRK